MAPDRATAGRATHARALRPAPTGAPALSLVIPCYNERERLEPVVVAALAVLATWPGGAELILVDDGSVDDTWLLIGQLQRGAADRVRCVRLARNCGKGAAVRAGFAVARGTIWGFADADGAAHWCGLTVLSRALDDPSVDAAIGERNGRDVETSLWRRVLGIGFRAAARALANAGVADTQCGLKLFRARTVAPLLDRLTIDGYAFDVELLHLLHATGASVRGVCVPWTHRPGSKVRPLRDGAAMLADLAVRWVLEMRRQRRRRADLLIERGDVRSRRTVRVMPAPETPRLPLPRRGAPARQR